MDKMVCLAFVMIVGFNMAVVSCLLLCLLCSGLAQEDIFARYYQQSRAIAEAMTIQQLAGQMVQADFQAVSNLEKETTDPNEAVTLALGSLLVSGMGVPTESGNLARIPIPEEYEKHLEALRKGNASNWKKLTDRFANLGVTVTAKTGGKFRVRFLLGTDAVHGDQHTIGTVLFPHNIGLSCSHNPAHFQNLGFWTKEGMRRSGFNYAFAPTVAISHNPQWGRFYETMGQVEKEVEGFAEAYVRGLQDVSQGTIRGVLASAKHFIGDGATLFGCNMGNANVLSFQKFLSRNGAGYVGSAKANVGSVMASYSGVNWIPNAINSNLLQETLREDFAFRGFTISDYNDLTMTAELLLPRTFVNFTAQEQAYAAMVNGGTDMLMLQHRAAVERVFKHARKMSDRNYLPRTRMVEAVTRILSVKMAMGLVDKVSLDGQFEPLVKVEASSVAPVSSSGDEYGDSLQAVRESLVLLKNNLNLLPASNLLGSVRYVVLLGEKIHNLNRLTRVQLYRNFDNIGMQCGGWTVRWQGVEGNQFWPSQVKAKIKASSILDALKLLQQQNNFELIFANYTNVNNEITIDNERIKFLSDLKTKRTNMNSRNTLIIGTFGEFPYAESVGDVNIPYCQTDNQAGCLYNPGENPYAPGAQKKTLAVEISKYDREVLSSVREADQKIPLVSVLLSGRPLIVEELLGLSDAVIAAWLPGTSGGQGIVDAIVGKYLFRPKSAPKANSLSVDWPKAQTELQSFPTYPSDGSVPRIDSRSFSVGDGLSTDFSSPAAE